MKFNVGDIIRSKYDMIIDNIDEEQEEVKKGQYFIVLSYGPKSEHYRSIGFKLLSQVSGSISYWEIGEAPLEGNFIKG